MVGKTSLAGIRDTLATTEIDPRIAEAINSMIRDWQLDSGKVEPLHAMQRLLEGIRRLPPGDARVRAMSSVVRTLGQPEKLATFLDMLRDVAARYGTREQELCRNKLQNVKMHSIYGWCGNTLLVESFDGPTSGTYPPIQGIGERLGNSTSAWNLTLHVWQPNVIAEGFPASEMIRPGIILEPPHSHPFEFVSTVVKGKMHQSIYELKQELDLDSKNCGNTAGYYDRTTLEHVDGIWPPHDFRETCRLATLEHRVPLEAGDCYYMPSDLIHDVEIDGGLAAHIPTITLFMSSEYLVMPHVFMTEAMAQFHNKNPNIKLTGAPIPESAWHKKLAAISAYLRGSSETLDLNGIVRHKGKYAFFHVNR